MTVFTPDEYAARIRRTRATMADNKVDLLVVGDPANMNYLSGYDQWSFYVPQAVVIPPEPHVPIWFGRGMDRQGAEATTWLGDENLVTYADHYVDNPSAHPASALATELEARGWGSVRVGIDEDVPYVTPRWEHELIRAMPRADVMLTPRIANRSRILKSEMEIELMRQAARIVESAMAAAISVSQPGVRECDAVSEIVSAQLQGTDSYGGHYPASWPHYLVGSRAGIPHAPWSDVPLQRDEAIAVELAGCRFRYHSALARTVVTGSPEQRLVDLANVVEEGMETILDFVHPGVTAAEIEGVWRAVLTDRGLEKPSRIGYSLGVAYPPSWGEGTVSLRPEDKTVLAPNMCFHVILGMWQEGWGYELSETIRVTADGVEVLTNFPRRIFEGGESLA